jgi:hypothetical protein
MKLKKRYIILSGIAAAAIIGYIMRRRIVYALQLPVIYQLDAMSLYRFKQLNPAFKPYIVSLIDKANTAGYDTIIVSGYRNYVDSVALAKQMGEANAPVVSAHLFALAVDLNFKNRATGKTITKSGSSKAEWEASGLLKIIRNLGMRTGADFSNADVNHVDILNKYPIEDLKDMAIAQYGDVQNVNGSELKIA